MMQTERTEAQKYVANRYVRGGGNDNQRSSGHGGEEHDMFRSFLLQVRREATGKDDDKSHGVWIEQLQ